VRVAWEESELSGMNGKRAIQLFRGVVPRMTRTRCPWIREAAKPHRKIACQLQRSLGRRGTVARPAVKWDADVVTVHHRPPLLGSPLAVVVGDSELLDIARARATRPRTGAEYCCPGRANFKNHSSGIRIGLPACDLKDHRVIASLSAWDYGYPSAN
jgi:hypothetical protein